FPENRILSHDLLEGCYARAGLLSDVQLYEEYPYRYSADVNRRHRWIRGDWQIARWLLPRVPGLDGRRQKNPLSGLSRWKIFDNLRRSLVPSALTLLILLGWTVLSPAWFWTLAAIGIFLIPALITCILDLLRKPDDVLLVSHLAASARCAARHFAQAAFAFACLPYEACFSLDAIIRTAVRMLVTRRRLLEWSPSTDGDRYDRITLLASCRSMWIAPLLAAATGIYLVLSKPAALASSVPILALWFASPAIAWWISRPLARREARLTVEQAVFLHRLSRKIWAFFDTFVGPEDHWLPPDNFQEHPVEAVGHRTSPTNMGLALLANLSAYDFGYIPGGQLIVRTENAFDTMESLERHRGHFYNWYDTKSLRPLLPAYVSSVDSGNLAGLLLTLRAGLIELPDHRVLAPQFFDGLDDTLRILADAAGEAAPAELAGLRRDLENALSSRPTSLAAARQCLGMLAKSTAAVEGSLHIDSGSQAQWWASALARQCQGALDDLAFLAPWTSMSPPKDPAGELSGLDEIPTLRELAGFDTKMLPAIEHRLLAARNPEKKAWLGELRPSIIEASRRARERIVAIERLALRSSQLSHMEYDFLYDKARHLLAIGYNVSAHRRDSSYYDLLASEARLASFVTIAQGQLPQESWFALGRLLTNAGGDPILLSWGGSMFEYLMPLLVMPTYENTLLDQTCKAAVDRQIEYGRARGVPWGISESGYHAVDVHLNYQYRAFGVPGLGLRRGLAEDLVIAPYASALALMVAPEEACRNLQRLADGGFEGRYGFYEAIDYTPSRQPRGQSSAVVRSFMAHHQGMSFLALAYLLLDRPMQKRFESDPLFQATTLLLQERVPKTTVFYSQAAELSTSLTAPRGLETPVRVFSTANTPLPEV
ncbi:MAG: glycosyltransferase, partial [Acidobacteria bacterium]|nr:glycosyltransferase [Acidobacteriota bacterium]